VDLQVQDDTDGSDYIYDELQKADDWSDLSEGHSESRESESESRAKTKQKKKKSGRKAKWSDSLINDMVDIILNNENYKRKLIFTNVKNQRNGDIYSKILEEMQKRATIRKESVPFTVVQLRTNFKKLIGECKKAALTIKCATGIKRFQDTKGYGDWFNPLFNLVKTRDACQPEQAIEPSASGTITNTDDSSSASQEGNMKKLFVPFKRNKKNKKKTALEEATTLLKKAVENDPIKDILEFMREDAEKSRQHELMLLQMQSVPPASHYQTFSQPLSFNVHPDGNQGHVQNNHESTHHRFNSTMFQGEIAPPMFQEIYNSENERRYHSL
jgi:hypothetical protein